MKDETLEQELVSLRRDKLAFQTQCRLLESFVASIRTPSETGLLRNMLQQTVDISEQLTGAERGSLFLMDEKGAVADFFLTRKSGSPQDASQIIGTVLNKGLAGWVLKHQRLGLIRDTRTDDRWIDLPDQPYQARSVLGIPILKGRDLFGILTLMHSEPDVFSEETAKAIVIAVSQLAVCLENAQLYAKLDSAYRSLAEAKQQIEAYSEALDSELIKGRRIQKNFLPVELPQIPDWSLASCFHPAKQVSGDFYDIFVLPHDHLGLVIADVCDKGVSAALFMGLFRSLIRIFGEQMPISDPVPDLGSQPSGGMTGEPGTNPSLTISNAISLANAYIEKHHSKEGIFATMFFAILNTASGSLHYINAGHEPLFLMQSSAEFEVLGPTGPAVGILPQSRFKVETRTLGQGHTLFGYTDGVIDAASANGERYGRERLLSTIRRAVTAPSGFLQHIENDLFRYIGTSELADDIAMIAVHRRSGAL